jgi:hypothetical protein
MAVYVKGAPKVGIFSKFGGEWTRGRVKGPEKSWMRELTSELIGK